MHRYWAVQLKYDGDLLIPLSIHIVTVLKHAWFKLHAEKE